MQRTTLDERNTVIARRSMEWLVFPDAIKARLAPILANYGYDEDGYPDTDELLATLELSFRGSPEGFPWALIFLDKEYPLGDHLLSIRPNRDIRYFNYTAANPVATRAQSVSGVAPPVSIIVVYSKSALEAASKSGSHLVAEAWEALRDKDEALHWAIVCDEIDSAWVAGVKHGSGA